MPSVLYIMDIQHRKATTNDDKFLLLQEYEGLDGGGGAGGSGIL